MSGADPVGAVEIAERLGVARRTVDQWRHRGLLPPPTWTVGGRPAWRWAVIDEWATRTGRAHLPGEAAASPFQGR